MTNKNIVKSQSETIKIKEEIADKYIQKFKEELGWLKSLAILPIETKLKKIMISGDKLENKSFDDLDDLGFWKKILGFLTPKMSIEIFDFLKEKQEAILTAETKNKLDNLMQEVIIGHKIEDENSSDTQDIDEEVDNQAVQNNQETQNNQEIQDVDQNQNIENDDNSDERNPALGASVAVAGYGVAGNYSMKLNEKITLKSNPSLAKIKKSYNNVIEILENQLENPKLLSEQKVNIRKSIKEFKYARDNTANLKSALKDIDALSKKDIMNLDDISKMLFDKSDIKLLNGLSKDESLLKSLSSIKSEKEIAKLLKSRGLNNISEPLLKALSKADDVSDLKSVLKVASNTKIVSKSARVLKSVPFLDAIAFGVDVMVYIDESNQADLIKKTNKLRGENKQSSAYLHLATGTASAAAGLTALAISTPPVGWIALGVAAVGVGVNEVMDTYYFNVVDFYTQNKEDYKKQYRAELKTAIYQATIHGDSSIPNSSTDGFAQVFNFSDSIKQSENITLRDAYWAMIFQEETNTGGYNDVLDINPQFPKDPSKDKLPKDKDRLERYKQSRLELSQKIETRMKYIQKFLPENNKYNPNASYNEFIKNIKTANGINYIENILAESKRYYEMKNTKNEELIGAETIKEYKDKLKSYLSNTNKNLFNKLEKIVDNDELGFLEIYSNIKSFKSGYLDTISKDGGLTDDKYPVLLKNAQYILDYYDYRFGDKALEYNIDMADIASNDIDYVDIKDFLLNIDSRDYIKPYQFTQSEAANQISSLKATERMGQLDLRMSDSVGQNIIYNIAKQLHGYVGANNMLELMNFFKEDKGDILGIYYSNGRYLNLNNQIDTVKLNLNDFDNMSAQQIIDKLFTYIDPNIGKQTRNNILNTATDNGDEQLNKSYINDVSQIITKEKSYTTIEYKKGLENDIVRYIKENSKGKYIELPYSLITKGLKSKIGELRYYTFKYENNKIIALTRGDLIQNTLNFDQYKIDYEKTTKIREKLTESETKLIENVDNAHKRLEQLRGVGGVSLLGGIKQDDLDLPIELEKTISQKWKERQNIKHSLYYTDKTTSKNTLTSSYDSYLNYFDGLYTGLLAIINNSSLSNDVDSIDYFNQALMFTNGINLSLDEEKGILLPDYILNDNQKEAFYYMLKEKPNKDNKSILELLKSKDSDDQQEGIWYAKQIIQSILESTNLSFNDKTGNIQDIYSPIAKNISKYGGAMYFGGLGVLVTMGLYSKQEALLLDNRLKANLSKPYTNSQETISNLDIPDFDTKPSVDSVQDAEINSYQNITKIESEIVDTKEDVDWSGKRGKIEKQGNNIESRGEKTTIEKNKSGYKIKDLSIVFKKEKEAIRVANFINKVKGDILQNNPENKGLFQWSIGGDLEINNGYVFDTNILESTTIESKMPSIQNSEKFIEYLNNL